MGNYVCSDCGRRWSGFTPSWWCEICREKHLANVRDVLEKKKKKKGE